MTDPIDREPAAAGPVAGVSGSAQDKERPGPESGHAAPPADDALAADASSVNAVEEADVADEESEQPAEPEVVEPDYKDEYLRALAETDNVRKRARRDIELANARGVAKLARELLPSLDNLDRALAAAEAEEGDADHHLTKGIRLVQSELLSALTRVGIEQFSPVGEQFDPHQHDAVAQQPVEGVASGLVAEVYQAGYRYKEEVLRAAKVVVAA